MSEIYLQDADKSAALGIQGEKSNRPDYLQDHPVFMTDEERKEHAEG